MKTYENNMADQDVVVHSLKVLSELKNPALSQLQRDLVIQKNTTQAMAQRTDKYWTTLSDDGVITPIEKKVVLREMESIANSYTALYTQAVAEQYDQAPFFQDYMATYNALRNYIYSTLHLFDNMEESTEVDREEFNEYFSNYYYSENYALVSMTVGVISDLGFKVLTSLEDEGEEGQVGIYEGVLYQYIEGEWKIINRDLYYGYSAALPPPLEGRYFLCTADGVLSDVLYVNDEPLEINGEMLEIGNTYERGYIYVYENNYWARKDPSEDYRYIVAMGDYYSLYQALPPVMKTEVENVARKVAGSNYCGALTVPPVDPQENDFFLYAGATSGTLPEDRSDWPDEPPPWIFASLYIYRDGRWKWLNEDQVQNQKYYMEALQDILSITATTSGYFTSVFCNAFFANQAAMNELSTKVIELRSGGAIRSEATSFIEGQQGLLIDADGNLKAYGNTILGSENGRCEINSNAIYKGSIESGCLFLYNVPAASVTVTANTSKSAKTFIDDLAAIYYTAGIVYRPDSLTVNSNSYVYFKYTHSMTGSNTVTERKYYDAQWELYSNTKYAWKCYYYDYTTITETYSVTVYYGNSESVTSSTTFTYTKTVISRTSGREWIQGYDNKPSITTVLPTPGTYYSGNCNFTMSMTVSMGTRTMKLVGLPNYSSSLPVNTVYVDNGVLKIKT